MKGNTKASPAGNLLSKIAIAMDEQITTIVMGDHEDSMERQQEHSS